MTSMFRRGFAPISHPRRAVLLGAQRSGQVHNRRSARINECEVGHA